MPQTYRPARNHYRQRRRKRGGGWPAALFLVLLLLALRLLGPALRQRAEMISPEETLAAQLLEPEEGGVQAGIASVELPAPPNCFFYNRLPDAEQECYQRILQALLDMADIIRLPVTDNDTVTDLIHLVLADHPEIFWFEGEGLITRYPLETTLKPYYTISAQERAEREARLAETVAAFTARIGPEETSYEKLATAFNFVTGNVTYELGVPDNQNLCSSLINGRSVCAGYAKGMQYLLHQVGIECAYVWGNVRDEGDHAWNLVNLDGTYYYSDVTFGDRTVSGALEAEVGLPDTLKQEYGYMCMNDEMCFRDRTLDLPALVSVPACTATEMSYYVRHGWYYSDYTDEIWADMRRELQDGEICWRYQFGTREAYDKVLEELADSRFASMALREHGLSSVNTYTTANDRLLIVAGWIP